MRPPYAFDPYYEPAHFYGTEFANLPPEEWERFRPVSHGGWWAEYLRETESGSYSRLFRAQRVVEMGFVPHRKLVELLHFE